MTVPPGKRPDARIVYQWICKTCVEDIGVPTSSAVERFSHIVVDAKTGKVLRSKGDKSLICDYCLTRGKITVVPTGERLN